MELSIAVYMLARRYKQTKTVWENDPHNFQLRLVDYFAHLRYSHRCFQSFRSIHGIYRDNDGTAILWRSVDGRIPAPPGMVENL